jgi:hypothetical protein
MGRAHRVEPRVLLVAEVANRKQFAPGELGRKQMLIGSIGNKISIHASPRWQRMFFRTLPLAEVGELGLIGSFQLSTCPLLEPRSNLSK